MFPTGQNRKPRWSVKLFSFCLHIKLLVLLDWLAGWLSRWMLFCTGSWVLLQRLDINSYSIKEASLANPFEVFFILLFKPGSFWKNVHFFLPIKSSSYSYVMLTHMPHKLAGKWYSVMRSRPGCIYCTIYAQSFKCQSCTNEIKCLIKHKSNKWARHSLSVFILLNLILILF